MDRRRERRTRKRVACELHAEETTHSGIVLDVSARGMFVQTSAKPRPGLEIEIVLKIPGWDEPLLLRAKVARKKEVPPQLMSVAQGGIGVRLLNPPPAYRKFVEEVEAGERPSVARDEDRVSVPKSTKRKRFRVHVAQLDGGGRDTYLITAASEEQAGERVLSELGEGWKLDHVEFV